MRTINEKISILNELKLKIDKITKTKNEKKKYYTDKTWKRANLYETKIYLSQN